MKVIITLIHGTWARAAPWTHPDSALCQILKATVEKIGAEVEFRPYEWSGANRLKARKEAAQGLVGQLRQDFKQAPEASHFLIAHSHGGNIMVDALREPGIGEHVSGIVTMSTPFVSSRRSALRITAVIFLVPIIIALGFLLYALLFSALFWVANQVESHITSRLLLWPIHVLELVLALAWTKQLVVFPFECASEFSVSAWDMVGDWQETFLYEFNHQLKQQIPMFCVRFSMDEALIALNFSRFLVKPVRILTFFASWLAAVAGIAFLVLWPVGFAMGLLDLLFGTTLVTWISWAITGAVMVLMFSVPCAFLFFIVWTVAGYVMVALTLGHWGGIVSQLLLDFRITGTPEGTTAVTKVYSPLRWRRTLLHSLTYADDRALEDISQWIASRMSNGGGNAPQSSRSA